MCVNNYYREDSNLFQRFGYHFVLGVVKDIGNRQECPKNLLEKFGDVGLWIVEELPKKIGTVLKDPRVVAVALTALAMLAASFIFYPVTTCMLAKATIALIPFPPFWAVRLSAYILTVTTILATACRAQGRFWNSQLMNQFYSHRG